MLTHRGVLNTIQGFNRQFGLDENDRFFGLVNYTFDLSVLDIFCAFTTGAALVLPQGQWRNDPEQWVSAIELHRATVWNSVPAHMQMLLTHLPQGRMLSSLRIGFFLATGSRWHCRTRYVSACPAWHPKASVARPRFR